MPGLRRTAACLLVAAAAALVPAAPVSAAPALPKCALGRVPVELRDVLPAAVSAAQQRYAASVRPADRGRASRAFAGGVAAYLYGMPTVLFRLTVERFPLNSLVGIARLATPASNTVVAPNHDTLYSVSRIDLSQGPVVIEAPATGGRYSVMQLLDAYTNAFTYIGSGPDRDQASTVALVPPGWNGAVPAGVRTVRSPTKLLWLLGRTLVAGPDDVPAASALMAAYGLTPLAGWEAGQRSRSTVLPSFPGPRVTIELPRGLAFYDALGQALAADPPPGRDACALRAFARAGIGPGRTPSADTDAVTRRALKAAGKAGNRIVDRIVSAAAGYSRRRYNGWGYSPPDTARFGTDYAHRAIIARVGLGSNTPSEAVYPTTDRDSRGRVLSGRHDYVVSFRAGELPPVRAFWSLTLYNSVRQLFANPLERYTISDRTAGLRHGPGGSLKVYVQDEPPSGARRANWLPAPSGRFHLYLRLYEPKRAAAEGEWTPPVVARID